MSNIDKFITSNLVKELDSKAAEVVSGGLSVSASDDLGTLFSNTTGQTRKYRLQASGFWHYASDGRPAVDAGGSSNIANADYVTDEAPPHALIMKRANRVYEMVGSYAEFSLNDGEFVHFLMNDKRGLYGDNKGFLQLEITEM